MKANNFPFTLNRNGICNGLALVHAKYVLEGRGKEFTNILTYISEGKRDKYITDEDINNFAFQALLAYAPQEFDHGLHQVTAMKALKIRGIPLAPSFGFCMAAPDENWTQALQDIALKDDEVMIIRSVDHVISVHKANGNYIVYDPNYNNGFKEFADEASLVTELHKKVFTYREGNLGLDIQILRHPEKQNKDRIYPTVVNLYEKYLPDAKATARCGKKEFKILEDAAGHNDKSVIEYLLNRGAEDYVDAVINAVRTNSPSALAPLLPRINDDEQVLRIWNYSLNSGRKEVIDILKQNARFKIYYNKYKAHGIFISAAASGNNASLLAETINDCKAVSSADLSKLILGQQTEMISKGWGSPLSHAINSGDVQSVKLLMKQLENCGTKLSDEQKIAFLLEAIRANRNSVTNYLITKKPGISRELMKTVNLTIYAVERTNILLLHDLQKHGVEFNNASQKLIDRKESKAITLIESLGIAVIKFAYFLKDMLDKEKGVHCDARMFKTVKQNSQAADDSQKPSEFPQERP